MAKETVSAEVSKMRQRSVYMQIRLPEIKDEIKALNEERKAIGVRVREEVLGEDQTKTLNRRRIYLANRVESLRAEQESLVKERRDINSKSK